LLPQTHATNALNKVLTLGAGAGEVTFELIALSVLTLLYFAIGVWLFRRMYLQAR
jgi:ABC-2 type transport system permease protein